MQHPAGMPTIDSAPKDGSEIYSFDGTWWRRQTRWQLPSASYPPLRLSEGWHHCHFLPVMPTHWCQPEGATVEIERMADEGLRKI